MIKNYIFDFGNVLGEFYPEKLTEPFVQDENIKKYISEVVFDRIYWDKLDLGTITDDEVKDGIKDRMPDDLKELACKVYDNWISSMTPVYGMQDLIFKISKTDKKLYLLSNISTGFADGYKNVKWIKELLSFFDGLVLSGTINMAKPNRDIFEYLLNTYNLKADECLFIDDNIENIKSAASIGIKTYLFDGDAQKLREYLDL